MRRKDREIKEKKEMRNILEQCEVCRMAMVDGDAPYVVPMSFGFVWEDELVFYFHGANAGKKIDLLKINPKVCLEFDTNVQLIKGDTACDYGTEYQSVIVRGEVEFLQLEEKREALDALMFQYTKRKGFSYPQIMLNKMAIYKVVATKVSAKEHKKKV